MKPKEIAKKLQDELNKGLNEELFAVVKTHNTYYVKFMGELIEKDLRSDILLAWEGNLSPLVSLLRNRAVELLYRSIVRIETVIYELVPELKQNEELGRKANELHNRLIDLRNVYVGISDEDLRDLI